MEDNVEEEDDDDDNDDVITWEGGTEDGTVTEDDEEDNWTSLELDDEDTYWSGSVLFLLSIFLATGIGFFRGVERRVEDLLIFDHSLFFNF